MADVDSMLSPRSATPDSTTSMPQSAQPSHGRPVIPPAVVPSNVTTPSTQAPSPPTHPQTCLSQISVPQVSLIPSSTQSPVPSRTSSVSSISSSSVAGDPNLQTAHPHAATTTAAQATTVASTTGQQDLTTGSQDAQDSPATPSTASAASSISAQPQQPPSPSSSSSLSSTSHVSPPPSPTWRPFSLRWPYLTVMMIISVLLLAAIETLRRVSIRRSGIWHLADPDVAKFSTGLIVLYTYVPTILGMIYSILWSYIDMDLKRTEPYLQMRKPRSPASLLFLDYVYESAVASPIRAFKRRHWFVAICSLTYLLISLVLPASQGALFGVDRVTYLSDTDITVSHNGLVMGPLVSGEYVDHARAISVPEGSNLPPWVTNNYSVIPFWPQSPSTSKNETWTADSTVYYAQPRCRRYSIDGKTTFTDAYGYGFEPTQEFSLATQVLVLWNISLPGSSPSCTLSISTTMTIWNPQGDHDYVFAIHTKGFTFTGLSNGLDSAVTEVQREIPANGSQAYNILDHNRDKWSSITWRNAPTTCPDMNYLAGLIELDTSKLKRNANMWDASTINASMILYDCDSDYYQALATVTTQGDNATVLSVETVENRTELTEAAFGHTDFGAMLESGSVTFIGGLDALNESRPDLRDIEHAASIADVVLGNLTSTPTDPHFFQSMMTSNAVGNAFEAAYKLVFALTLKGMIDSPAQARMAPIESDGTTSVDIFAVVVVSEFAILSEALLALGMVALLLLLVGYGRRKTMLASDPDSISAQCSIISDVITTPGILASSGPHLDLLQTKDLCKEVSRTHLEYDETGHTLSVVTQSQQMTAMNTSNAVLQGKLKSDPLPKFMRKKGMAITASLLLAMLALMIALLIWVRKVGGFSYLSDSSTLQSQFLYSFLPTIFATCLETFWMSVHRDLSVLETWAAMRQGYTKAEECLSLRYSSRPPSLVLFLSLRRRHFLLAFVSLLCLSTSVLNIVMAGLFLSSYKNFETNLSTFPRYRSSSLPDFWWDDYNINQAFSVVRSRYSDDAQFPPWMDKDRAFLPIDLAGIQNRASAYGNETRVSTTATSIESYLKCSSLKYDFTDDPNGPGIFQDAQNQTTVRYSPSQAYRDANITCGVPFDWSLFTVGLFFKSLQPINMTTNSKTVVSLRPSCPILVVSTTVSRNATIQLYGSTLYTCQPQVQVATYDIETELDGKILSANLSHIEANTSSSLRGEQQFLDYYTRKYMGVTIYSFKTRENTTYDWSGLLMTRIRDNSNITSVPELADSIWRTTFATWFALYNNQFLSPRNSTVGINAVTLEIVSREARMVPVIPAFDIAIVLLAAYLAAYIFVVSRRRHRYAGPRMPKTIGSIMPWVLHSRMLNDFAGTHSMSSRERDAELKRMNRRYAFGRFRGKHGKITLGIEHEELLIARGALGDF